MNCSQIFCTFAAETTRCWRYIPLLWLWIALKFFVLLQPKQRNISFTDPRRGCELLSNFLYFCSRNNSAKPIPLPAYVVNCSQIFCTFAAETTVHALKPSRGVLWIALKFFVLLQPKQQRKRTWVCFTCCELLSNFLYFCSRNNFIYTRGETVPLWIALKFFVLLQPKQHTLVVNACACCCELLSNFLYFCSRNNTPFCFNNLASVVNCSQIFCTFAAETTKCIILIPDIVLWIALKFFVLLQPKQHSICQYLRLACCELLSNFLYFCSRNNYLSTSYIRHSVVNCSQIFCTFAAETTRYA